jgi:hypothetical protein
MLILGIQVFGPIERPRLKRGLWDLKELSCGDRTFGILLYRQAEVLVWWLPSSFTAIYRSMYFDSDIKMLPSKKFRPDEHD